MKGKLYHAESCHCLSDAECEGAVYIVSADNIADLKNEYRIVNQIVKPGHKAFVLKNVITGKTKRAKHIFVTIR